MEDTTAQQNHLQNKLHQLQQSAAEQELSGQLVSDPLKQNIESARQDIVDNQLHLEGLQADKLNSSQQYEHDLIRLRQLQSLRREAASQ